MRRLLIALLITSLFVCAAPVAALSIETSGGTAGHAVVVTLDVPAFVTFQMDGGVPVYAFGSSVSFIPALGGTLSITATAAGQTADVTVPVSSTGGGSGGGNSGGGSDTPSVFWRTVTLPTGNFNVTADNSKKTYPVPWQSGLGVLQKAGISFKVSDKWDSGLFTIEVDGTPNEGLAGWMYQVNGIGPGVTADQKPVSTGDEVIWYYSESMSQTPDQSPKVFYFRVQTSSTPASGGSSSETGTTGDGVPADDVTSGRVSHPLSLPPGSDLRLSEGRMYLTVNVPMATSAGDEITFAGNTMIITRDDVVLRIRFVDFTDKSGVVSGDIADVTVETRPVQVTCADGATPEIGLFVSLMTVPMDADIGVTVTPISDPSDLSTVPTTILSAANAALGADGMAVGTASWLMNVEKRNLENEVDVGDVTVRITVDPAHIAQAGGLSALRLVHIMDDGTAEVLALRSAGTTTDGKMILEAGPAAGLSSFLFVSITDAPASSVTVATPAPASQTTSPAPTKSGVSLCPLFAAAGLIGVTGIYRNRKR